MLFFGNKEKKHPVRDLVFATQQAKWNALLEAAKQDIQPVFIAWFENSMDKLQTFFQQHQQEAQIITYRQVHSGLIGEKPAIFIEHFPLPKKEQQVFASLANNSISIYSSLDEAFFKYFGGDRISALLDKMGVQENEAISHSMITKAIANAQEKLAQKITMEESAYSMEEWMQKNIGTVIP